MSKVRDLPETSTLADSDLLYVVDVSEGPNAGRKVLKSTLRDAVQPTASEIKTLYESNPDTNAFTDAEQTKLAGIEAGATADQNANEVPFDNAGTFLAATDVQAAIEEVNDDIIDFKVMVSSGLIVSYRGGQARFDSVFYDVLNGSLLLNPNITSGEIYLDIDGVVKQTASNTASPPMSIPMAIFSTDATDVIALADTRQHISPSSSRGEASDITDVNADSVAAAGTTRKYADAGHTHSVSTGSASTIIPDQANAEGSSANLARADHIHNIPTDAPITILDPSTTNAEGSESSFARSDHTHAVATALVGDITTIQPDDSASAGVTNVYARGDHRHAVATAAPASQSPDQANAEGVSTSFARADHIHNIPTDAPATTLSPSTTNTEGAGSSFARNDHTHAVSTALVGDITTIQPDDAASAGTANTFARGDHRHAIAAAAPSNTGTANSEGASTSFARADHVHNTVIANSTVTATADDTTTSLTDVLIVGMTLTPAAGTYLVTFSSSVVNSANGATRLYISLYVGGSQVTHSERNIGIAGGANTSTHTHAIVTVNGSQAIEARWRAVAGTNTARQRSLSLVRLRD